MLFFQVNVQYNHLVNGKMKRDNKSYLISHEYKPDNDIMIEWEERQNNIKVTRLTIREVQENKNSMKKSINLEQNGIC